MMDALIQDRVYRQTDVWGLILDQTQKQRDELLIAETNVEPIFRQWSIANKSSENLWTMLRRVQVDTAYGRRELRNEIES